jgi:hypothetical protein
MSTYLNFGILGEDGVQMIYNEGDECTAITNGWEQVYAYNCNGTGSSCTFSSLSSYLYQYVHGSDYADTEAACGAYSPIDITDYSYLKAVISYSALDYSSWDDGILAFIVSGTKAGNYDTYDARWYINTTSSATNREVSVDISSLSGYKYIRFNVRCDRTAGRNAKLHQAWLE